jgi:glycosyltransferase involved in cell wall biosynthesis
MKTNLLKLSIITPVYNGERFIECCIKNVISQNCSDVEHIIVDGGSTDSTLEIIKRYARQYSHIRWISENDDGQPDALNKGIAMAQGSILGILNYDDFYEAGVFKQVIEIFKILSEPSLVVGNCNIWNHEGVLSCVNEPKKLRVTDLLLGYTVNPIPANPSAYFYHASLHKKIGPYNKELHYNNDLDFILRAVQAATVKYIDKTWGNFRVLKETKTFQRTRTDEWKNKDKIILEHYRKKLPFLQRICAKVKYEIYNNKTYAQFKRYVKKILRIIFRYKNRSG